MAELLIRLKNNTNADPVKDRMCYKRGDIVVVKPDGHHWGRAEGLPHFAVIQTDRTVTQMEKFLAVHETPQSYTEEIPSIEWVKMQSRGSYGMFTAKPTERAIGTVRVKGKSMPVVKLSGLVDKPHTRRKWSVNTGVLSLRSETKLLTKGRVTIPFADLRPALKDKITGAQA